MTMAMTDEITVTHSRSAMPNRSVEPSTSQTRLVRKLTWSLASEGIAWVSRNAATRATRTMTRIPAPVAAPPKMRSPSRPVLARSAPPSPTGPSPTVSTVETPVMLLIQSVPVRRSAQRCDGGGDLGLHGRRERSRADLGQRGLDVRAGEVGQERLDRGALRGVLGLRADDLVRDQVDRVGPGRLGRVVDL